MEVIYPVSEKKAIHPIAIFKEGFELWVRNFLSLSSIYFISYLPVIVLQVLFPGPKVCGLKPGSKNAPHDILIYLFPFLVLLVGSWVFVAVSLAVDKLMRGERAGIWENIIAARKRFSPYLGTLLLSGLVYLIIFATIMMTSLLLVRAFPAWIENWMLISLLSAATLGTFAELYFAIRLSLGSIISVIDDTAGPLIALRRSHALIKRYVTAVVGAYALLLLISFLFFLVIMFLGVAIKALKVPDAWLNPFDSLFSIILVPLWISVMVALYKKLKEAVDILPSEVR